MKKLMTNSAIAVAVAPPVKATIPASSQASTGMSTRYSKPHRKHDRREDESQSVAKSAAPMLAPILRARRKIIAHTTIVEAIVSSRPASSAAIGPVPNIGASFAVSEGTTGPYTSGINGATRKSR